MGALEYPRRSSLELCYNGVNASGDFSDEMESFSYEDVASGEADAIEITVNNQSGRWLDRYMPEQGDYVEAEIAVENWDREGDNRRLSCGKFELDSFRAEGFPQTVSIRGITTPILTDFNVTAKNRIYSNTTAKMILSDICAGAGISLVYEAEDYTVEEAEQSGQTDMSFSFSLCSAHNLAMKLYNNKMVVYDQTNYEKKEPCYAIDRSEMQKYTYSLERTNLYDSVQIQYADPSSDETLTYSYTVPGESGRRKLFLNEQADSYRDAEIIAKSRLLENIRNAASISFTVRGDTKHMSARNVEITGLGKADGIYFIDRVTHSKSAKGVYTCAVKAHLCVTHTEFSVPKVQEAKAAGTTYTVVKGDCLWNIAKKFYGSGAKYTVIYNANKGIIKNPSLIYPGQVLTIPPG